MEYYSLVCSALKSATLGLWMMNTAQGTRLSDSDMVLDDSKGLFLKPLEELSLSSAARVNLVKHLEIIGLLLGKSILDHHAIDLNLHPILLDALFQRPVLMTWTTLYTVDSEFALNLEKLFSLSSTDLASLDLNFTHPMDANIALKVNSFFRLPLFLLMIIR